MSTPTTRHIPDRLNSARERALKSWESLLFVVLLAVIIINCFSSSHFLDPWSLSDATYNFTEKALVAFPLALVIIAAEIDLSVAAIIALASTLMGAAMHLGAGPCLLIAIGIVVGTLCGAVNGWLVAGLGLPSIVVTIGTMSLFRGIAYIILGDQAYTGYPATLAWFGQGYVWYVFSFEFVLFLAMAVVFHILLRRTTFGRLIYTIGSNPVAAQFSGIRVARLKFILFVLTGLMCGVAAVCLTGRLGSTRPSIATGLELEAITMVVLGGVNINGGSGTILGVVLAAVIMGLVTFGFGLLNVPGIVMSIFIGLLLIAVIAIPKLMRSKTSRRGQH